MPAPSNLRVMVRELVLERRMSPREFWAYIARIFEGARL